MILSPTSRYPILTRDTRTCTSSKITVPRNRTSVLFIHAAHSIRTNGRSPYDKRD